MVGAWLRRLSIVAVTLIVVQAAAVTTSSVSPVALAATGDIVLSTASTLTVTAVSESAVCNSSFGMESPDNLTIFPDTHSEIGQQWESSAYPANTSLVFWFTPHPTGIYCSPEQTFLSTDPARAHVQDQGNGTWLISWNDSWSGDQDFNDLVVKIVATPAAVRPVVTSVSPSAGSTVGGTSVTITGSGFNGATSVSFGGEAALYNIDSDTQITATSPAHTVGTVDVTVTTPGGTSPTSNADQFTYVVTTINYFALGDSIASGHGLMDDANGSLASGLCHRSQQYAYPALVAKDLQQRYTNVNFHLLACSGATAGTHQPTLLNQILQLLPSQRSPGTSRSNPDLLLSNQVDSVVSALNSNSIPSDQPVLVSITVGMDDIGWTDPATVLQLLELPDDAYFNTIDTQTNTTAQNVKEQVTRLLNGHPNVVVILTDYPNPVNPDSKIFAFADQIASLLFGNTSFGSLLFGNTSFGSSPFRNIPFGQGPRLFGKPCTDLTRQLDCYGRSEQAVQLLNSKLIVDVAGALANQYPGQIGPASVYETFKDHESPQPVCGASGPSEANSWIQYPGEQGINSPLPWPEPQALGTQAQYGDCFHPNYEGAGVYANAVNQRAIKLGR